MTGYRQKRYSLLDLAPVREGGSIGETFGNTLDLARHAEQWGFTRFWLAEHHNMPGIASAATTLVMQNALQATKTIRVGAGGIMLPNHAPIVIAEQFGTLEALYPGRIDLGLGRAPGGDQRVAMALRRTLVGGEDRFPQDVVELMTLLGPSAPRQAVRAIPGEGAKTPIWILGSSTFGAQLAAALGVPFAFASHFAPAQMMDAIAIYRQTFRPSEQLQRPYVMLGFNIFAAPTDEEGRLLATSLMQAFASLRRGIPGQLQPPDAAFEATLSDVERAQLEQVFACSAIGSPQTVKGSLAAFIARTGADELILASHIFDHGARVRAYEITAEVRAEMGA